MLGEHPATISTQLSRGRSRLRTLLEQEGLAWKTYHQSMKELHFTREEKEAMTERLMRASRPLRAVCAPSGGWPQRVWRPRWC